MFYSIEDFKRIIKETATQIAGSRKDANTTTWFDKKPYVDRRYGILSERELFRALDDKGLTEIASNWDNLYEAFRQLKAEGTLRAFGTNLGDFMLEVVGMQQ
ncbi:MAG: hypothetical protein M1378_00170 [Bacteroidetes bacterium]|nr:hypothetical protein [Bacteroidota bacterium]